MKQIVFGSFFYLIAVATAGAAGYYEQRVSACDPVAMQREMDAATARTRAGITVVKCDAAPAHRPAPVAHRVEYVDLCCDCVY